MAMNNSQKTTLLGVASAYSKAQEQISTLPEIQGASKVLEQISMLPEIQGVASAFSSLSKVLEQSGIVGLQSIAPIWSVERSFAGVQAPRRVNAGNDRNETNSGECGTCGNPPRIEQLKEGVLGLSCDPCGYSMQLDP